MSGTDRDEASAAPGDGATGDAAADADTGTETEAEAAGDDARALSGGDPGTAARPRSDRQTTVIVRTVTRAVVPIIFVTAIALLLQGHNLPGGGFIGGVLTATAFALLSVVFGLDYIQSELISYTDDDANAVEGYRWLFSVGLALAATSGVAPLLLGYPFLTQAVAFVDGIPVYEELEIASALAFDVGVYFTVVGALLTVLAEVGGE